MPHRILPLLLAAAALAGCGPKLVREPVYESEFVRVELRRLEEGGRPLALGHDHPVQIAAVRLAHILAGVSHVDSKEATKPTIRTEHVYDLAEGLSKAFAKAGPDDELVALATAHDRRLGIFSDRRATAFRAYMHGGQLHLDFYAIEEDWRPSDQRSEGYEVPAKLPDTRPSFRLAPAQAMAVAGPRSLVIDWRDDFFRKPVNLSVRFGQVRRRSVLLESETEQEDEPSQLPVPTSASDAQRQALDQLDAARRSGMIPEAEFQRRRRLILDGRLEEAGYGPAAAPGSP